MPGYEPGAATCRWDDTAVSQYLAVCGRCFPWRVQPNPMTGMTTPPVPATSDTRRESAAPTGPYPLPPIALSISPRPWLPFPLAPWPLRFRRGERGGLRAVLTSARYTSLHQSYQWSRASVKVLLQRLDIVGPAPLTLYLGAPGLQPSQHRSQITPMHLPAKGGG